MVIKFSWKEKWFAVSSVLVIYIITFRRFQSPTGNMYDEHHQVIEFIESPMLWLQFRFTFTLIGDKRTSRFSPIVVRNLRCLFPLAQYRNKYLLVTNLEAVFYSTPATLLPSWSLLVRKMDQLKPKHTSSISLYLNDYLSLRSPSNTHHH